MLRVGLLRKFEVVRVVSQFEISPSGNKEVGAADVAAHDVVDVLGGNSSKVRSAFVADPATGALVLRPDLGLKFEKALRREARVIAIRLYLKLLPLYLFNLRLKFRKARLNLARKVL